VHTAVCGVSFSECGVGMCTLAVVSTHSQYVHYVDMTLRFPVLQTYGLL
jgi:hypothetical protein